MSAPDSIAPDAATDQWTTRRLLSWMTDRFKSAGVEPPRLVAEMLLADVIGCERMRLYMEADRPASEDERTRLRPHIVAASSGMPVQYIVGRAHFFGRDFLVDDSTLIPQPCTEELVAAVIRHVRPNKPSVFERFGLDEIADEVMARAGDESVDASADPDPAPRGVIRIADVGTGSGCIGISIALGLPDAEVWIGDSVEAALALAARNIEHFGVTDRVHIVHGSLLDPFPQEPFDVIVANLPYIPDHEWNSDQVAADVRTHVPETALRGGPDGLDLIRPLIAATPKHLKPGGLLGLECADTHADDVATIVNANGHFDDVRIERDSDGYKRIVFALRKSG